MSSAIFNKKKVYSDLFINVCALRTSTHSPRMLLGLTDWGSIGEKSSTMIFGHVATKWFRVYPEKNNWILNPIGLIGKKAEVEVTGTLLAKSSWCIKEN